MSKQLEQDIQSWIISRMMSFSLATTSKRSNAPEVAFRQFSGIHDTATSMPAQTLEKLWTGALKLPFKVTLRFPLEPL